MTDTQKKAGGRRPGAGRRKGSFIGAAPKTGRIVIACTEAEEAEIKRQAAAAGKSVSRFVVDALLLK